MEKNCQLNRTLSKEMLTNTYKRALVTGGAGFLGVHLCRRLLDNGYEVICLDNLFTSQRENFAEFLTHPRFEFIRHDVTVPYQYEVDEIYNLACPASPCHYQFDPIKTTKVSVLGALHALGLANRLKAKVFQASTSEIYGDPLVSPQTEEYYGHVNCIGVRSCYDEGKRVAETLFFDYFRQHQVNIRVARIFNTYGPGMHPYDGRVVSNFIIQALHGFDITIYGDGTQTRSFCYVDDLIQAILLFTEQEAHNGPLNIGNPNEMTVKKLAELVIRLTQSSSKIVYMPLPGNDPKQRKPDISKAKEVLDWEPRVSIEEGLEKTIEYFRSLDLSKFHKLTSNTAHARTEHDEKLQAN